MNKRLLVLALFFVPLVAFAEDAPMSTWQFNGYATILNGQHFMPHEYGASFREQDGYAIVQGRKIHYWLYDTYTYHNGDGEVIALQIVPQWVEKMGYVVDYDNIEVYSPNPALASSVKTLMSMRGCDISVALVTDNPGYDYVVLNDYDKNKGTYTTVIYPLYK